jgi:hypothetical protein
MPEVDGRDPQRAQRRQHDQTDAVGVPRDVGNQALLDEQAQGLDGDRERPGRRCRERAGVPGRQHVHLVGAEGDRLGDGRVVGQSAIDERPPVPPHRGQYGRDGAAGQDRADGVALREQHFLA